VIGGGRLGRLGRLVAAASIIVAAGCAQVIGAEGYSDAVEALCACPELAEISDCITLARKRIAAAKPPEQESWLDRYATTCGGSCGKSAFVCFDGDPVCTPLDEASFSSEECRGYTQGAGCCPDPLDPAASVCCARCLTCGEILADVQRPDPLCTDARELVFDAVDCLCDACTNVCAENCPSGPFSNLTAACTVCFEAATRIGGACSDEFLVCAADVPYAP